MLVTEPSERLAEIVEEAISGGVNIVQLREKSAGPEQVRKVAKRLRSITEGRALFVVNGQAEAARDAGADGVHLPEKVGSIAEARRIVGVEALIGRSVHSLEAACSAEREGADYLVAGTIFESLSHPCEKPSGLGFLADICRVVTIPVLAIGGISPENVGNCIAAGAAGVAVLSPIMRADYPTAAARAYRLALEEAVAARNTR